jgi:hypothetical protein
MINSMPTVHMSEAEVASDLHAARAKVQHGIEIVWWPSSGHRSQPGG